MGNPIFSENSAYAAEFLRYLATHPEVAVRIPEGAVVVFLPERDPGLAAHNRLAAESTKALPGHCADLCDRSDNVGAWTAL